MPNCAAPSLPKATECFSYDGTGALAAADFIEGTNSTDQTLTWSTAGGGVPSLAVWTDDANGSTQHNDFIDGPDGLPLEQVNINGSTTTADWYYQDPSGNTRVLLDSSGNVDQSYNYDDYGNESDGEPARRACYTPSLSGRLYGHGWDRFRLHAGALVRPSYSAVHRPETRMWPRPCNRTHMLAITH